MASISIELWNNALEDKDPIRELGIDKIDITIGDGILDIIAKLFALLKPKAEGPPG